MLEKLTNGENRKHIYYYYQVVGNISFEFFLTVFHADMPYIIYRKAGFFDVTYSSINSEFT